MRLIMALSLLFSFAHAGEKLQLGVENSWPPYSEKNGEGYSKEIVKKAFEHSGVSPDFIVLPYARVLDFVEKGKVQGGFNVTKQTTTERMFYFNKTPILTAKASFYFPPKSRYLGAKSLNELPKGLRIGLISGYEYGDIYEINRSNFQETRVKTQEQIINMLLKNRIDCAIMFDEVAKYTMESMGVKEKKIIKSFHNHTSEIYVAFNKQNPNSVRYGRMLDKGIEALKKSGEYQKILKDVTDPLL